MIRSIAPVCHEEVKPWCYWSWTILKVSMIVVLTSSNRIWCAVLLDSFESDQTLKNLAITWASTSLMCWGSQVHTWVCFKPRKWSLNILPCFLFSSNKQQGKNEQKQTNHKQQTNNKQAKKQISLCFKPGKWSLNILPCFLCSRARWF